MRHTVIVWDFPLRVFHLLLIISVGFSYLCAEFELQISWHMDAGIVVMSLLVFRLAWGFVGGYFSRFSSFVMSVQRRGCADSERLGHSPGAVLSIAFVLLLLGLQTGSGLFVLNDESDVAGPLYPYVDSTWVEAFGRWHRVGANLFLLWLLLHIVAVVYYQWHGRNLIAAMVHGRVILKNIEGVAVLVKPRRWSLLLAVAPALFTLWFFCSGVLAP